MFKYYYVLEYRQNTALKFVLFTYNYGKILVPIANKLLYTMKCY